MSGPLLSVEQLRAAASQPPESERVFVPELGGDVIIRGMTGMQRDAWEKSMVAGVGKRARMTTDNLRARLAVRCLVDEAGARILKDDDIAWMGNLPAKILDRIFTVAQRLSGVSDEDLDELGTASGTS